MLEIGVGSGLLLSQIAPRCEHYVATDMSAVAVDKLARALDELQVPWRDRVQLSAQPAHVTEGLPQGYFDTVIINSVVQYFPSAGYLSDLIDSAMDLLAPAGSLFIGDVRNHSLQGAFQTAVTLARADAGDADEIRRRIQLAVVSEPELLLAPEFFTSWSAEHRSVAGLDIEVKRGWADNELTRYRYDVIVHKTPAPVRSLATAPTWTWTQCAGLRGLEDQLASEQPAVIRITEIPAPDSSPTSTSKTRWRPDYPSTMRSPKPSPRPPIPPLLNNCTTSAKPADITSPSRGAPDPAAWMPSS